MDIGFGGDVWFAGRNRRDTANVCPSLADLDRQARRGGGLSGERLGRVVVFLFSLKWDLISPFEQAFDMMMTYKETPHIGHQMPHPIYSISAAALPRVVGIGWR